MRRRLALVALIALAGSLGLLGACGDPDVERLTAIRDTVCACKTTACADQAIKTVPDKPGKPTRILQGIARDMLECMARLKAAEEDAEGGQGGDGADPDGDPAAVSDPRIVAPASARTP